MADEEKKEITIVVSSCTEKEWPDGSKSFVVECTLDGASQTFYCKEDLGMGSVKVTRYGDKKQVYKVKQNPGGGGGGNFPAKAKDYTIENRQKALDAVIAHAGGKGTLHDLCTHAAKVVEFYKTGAIPPKPEAQQ